MTPQDEVRAAGRLAGDVVSGSIGIVRDAHHAVLGRVDSVLPVARPVTGIQRAVSSVVYRTVAAARLVPGVGGEAAAGWWPQSAPQPSTTKLGRRLLPALNGLWGDTIAGREPALAVPMALRIDARDLSIDRRAVAAAFPDASSAVVVFVHGLCESDESWWRSAGSTDGFPEANAHVASPSRSYGDRLHSDLGMTPLYLRFNSGLRVSANGRQLADLLDVLYHQWPVPIEDLTLVGHSMGGLVARSACHIGDEQSMRWVAAVTRVVTLGTPHLGAPLEKAVHITDWAMSQVPETAPFSRLLRARSLGVKDLRFGSLVDGDWSGRDPDGFLADTCAEVPFLSSATYYWVAATFTNDADHPLGRLLGDGLVRYPSASGSDESRRVPLDLENGLHLAGVDHLTLLNHPAVYDQLRRWVDHG